MTGCALCPRRCGADRAVSRGYCGSGEKLRIARAALHFCCLLYPSYSGET